MKRISDFLRNQGGGVAVVAAITAIPLAIGVAGAVDMVRANRIQTVLQGASDAAAIAGATSKKTQKNDYDKIVKDYLKANGSYDALSTITKIESERDPTTRQFTVLIEGKVETGLLGLIGVSEMVVSAKSIVGVGGAPLELALVLDNTGSMAGSRIDALRAAALHFVDELMVRPNGNSDVKVGVVPFANYVNVGLAARSKTWLNVPAETTTTTNYCSDTYPNATSSNCRPMTGTGYNDGIPYTYTYQQCDWNYGAPVNVCGSYTAVNKWNGCVGSRSAPLDRSIGTFSANYTGILNETCPAELVPLTNSASKVISAINSMVTTGNTYIPSGLVWGWNMLESNEPIEGAYTQAKVTSIGGAKSIVLMTDGANTLAPTYPYHVEELTGVNANAITAELCENIKADNIQIYTVAFEVTDPGTKAMLNTCASSPEMAFVADNAAALMASFDEIAEGLSDIRLIE
jgi:Flp pilus assembly protein TadG